MVGFPATTTSRIERGSQGRPSMARPRYPSRVRWSRRPGFSVSKRMRAMTSLPANRWGFSKEAVPRASPVSRSRRRITTVVVPASTASPWSGPGGASTGSPSR